MPVKKDVRSIKLLPPELRDQIAAGEVVERPASVLKELLENSLDAGADDVIVRIEDGGQSYISVQDNGHGICADELELAVTSHATSKVHSFSDLLRVSSYGFRGEALPSVASVSRLRVSSSTGAGEAAFIESHYGRIAQRGPLALPQGTLVEMRDLFSNVPARLKFLKANATELKHCRETLLRLALARLEAGFLLLSGGRELCRMASGEGLPERLGHIWPPQIIADLKPVRWEGDGLKFFGLASTPGSSQPRADRLLFYVNGRAVNDRLLLRACREAYKNRLLSREYPQAVLFLELDPEEVDVNVHPAKTEVRFRDERRVFAAAFRALEDMLSRCAFKTAADLEIEEAAPAGDVFAPLYSGEDTPLRPKGFWGTADQPRPGRGLGVPGELSGRTGDLYAADEGDGRDAGLLREDTAAFGPEAAAEGVIPAGRRPADEGASPCVHPFQDVPPAGLEVEDGLFYMGQVAETYLVLMRDRALILLDQHAAHECVLMRRFSAEAGCGRGRLLALPLELALHPAEAERLERLWTELAALGFSLSVPGQNLLLVKAVPPLFQAAEAREFLRDALADKGGGMPPLLAMMACKAAVKAGRRMDRAEAMDLIRQWLKTPGREFCPHGRPAVLTLGEAELEKMFKRKS
ncbi:MAG: DNA mismatch repair endonuclease MutL [Deltaproteobacteria bacterium]|jgi:DNA mismatch repair protein MutL|nr:DNA mismatch repair endonuclease MutL [Deltaproteobacteria bacterium]